MEKEQQVGERLFQTVKNRIKLFGGDILWFSKYLVLDIFLDIKKTLKSKKTYIYLLFFLLVYSLLLSTNKINLIIISILFFVAIFMDMWDIGDWKDYKRKQEKKKYFSQPHPEKLQKEVIKRDAEN